MIDIGRASDGMIVAETFLRKMNMTRMTRAMVSSSVNLTSSTEDRIETDRSYSVSMRTAAGMCSSSRGSSFLMLSTTATVLVPGCF